MSSEPGFLTHVAPPEELRPFLDGFHVVIALPVQWGDQDAFQHVNNSVYFRWFETGRIAYWRRIGLWDLLTSDRIGPILASVTCDYRRQLGYPDSIFVGTRVARIGRTSLAMEQVVVSCAENGVAAEGRSTGVVFDYAANTPTPVPPAVRAAIAALEGWPAGASAATTAL